MPKLLFDGESSYFTVPDIERRARYYLVTFFAGQGSSMSDTYSVIIKNGENSIGIYKGLYHGNGPAYGAMIQMQNYTISQYTSASSWDPVGLLKIRKVVAFYQ